MKHMEILKANEHKFWRNVKKEEGCWIWKAYKNKDGYGDFQFGFLGKKYRFKAHRTSYELTFGKIEKDKIACHKCDNPICVNPYHLFIGTHADNSKDKILKGRQVIAEINGRTKLNWGKINEIREKGNNGVSTSILSEEYEIDVTHIRKILHGKQWKNPNYNVELNPITNKPKFQLPQIPKNRTINEETAKKIKEAIKNRGNKTLISIALDFDVKYQLIRDIVREKIFRNV